MTKKVGFVGLLAILFVLSMAIGISAMAAGSAEWENQSGQGSVAEADEKDPFKKIKNER